MSILHKLHCQIFHGKLSVVLLSCINIYFFKNAWCFLEIDEYAWCFSWCFFFFKPVMAHQPVVRLLYNVLLHLANILEHRKPHLTHKKISQPNLYWHTLTDNNDLLNQNSSIHCWQFWSVLCWHNYGTEPCHNEENLCHISDTILLPIWSTTLAGLPSRNFWTTSKLFKNICYNYFLLEIILKHHWHQSSVKVW